MTNCLYYLVCAVAVPVIVHAVWADLSRKNASERPEA